MRFYKNAEKKTTENTTTNVKISPPWITYTNSVKAIFEKDPHVEVTYSNEDATLFLLIEGTEKFNAISALLPREKTFGNVTLTIDIEQKDNQLGNADLFKAAFNGNEALVDFESFDTPFGPQHYAIFKKEVVQFYDDNLGDINGLKSTLYENIAREIFGDLSVHYCTSKE